MKFHCRGPHSRDSSTLTTVKAPFSRDHLPAPPVLEASVLEARRTSGHWACCASTWPRAFCLDPLGIFLNLHLLEGTSAASEPPLLCSPLLRCSFYLALLMCVPCKPLSVGLELDSCLCSHSSMGGPFAERELSKVQLMDSLLKCVSRFPSSRQSKSSKPKRNWGC